MQNTQKYCTMLKCRTASLFHLAGTYFSSFSLLYTLNTHYTLFLSHSLALFIVRCRFFFLFFFCVLNLYRSLSNVMSDYTGYFFTDHSFTVYDSIQTWWSSQLGYFVGIFKVLLLFIFPKKPCLSISAVLWFNPYYNPGKYLILSAIYIKICVCVCGFGGGHEGPFGSSTCHVHSISLVFWISTRVPIVQLLVRGGVVCLQSSLVLCEHVCQLTTLSRHDTATLWQS